MRRFRNNPARRRVRNGSRRCRASRQPRKRGIAQPAGGSAMNNIIYLVGLVVVVLAILSFLGLR
ncbi:MAG: hypothetical protein C0458_20440 [Methylobacterium sp.]|jgi:hypothetical protein|nr:hypothetical protein [Methylobacterium sp.]